MGGCELRPWVSLPGVSIPRPRPWSIRRACLKRLRFHGAMNTVDDPPYRRLPTLPPRSRRGEGARPGDVGDPRRPLRGLDGPFRLGQVDAAQLALGHRPSRRGRRRGGRPAAERSVRGRARGLAVAPRRADLPVLQLAAGAERARERRAAAAPRRAPRRGAPAAGRDRAHGRRPGARAFRPAPRHALGRRAAARGDRPRHRHRSRPHRRGRAYRRPRREERGRGARAAVRAQPRVSQGDRARHPRPSRALVGGRGPSPRQGAPARGGREGAGDRVARAGARHDSGAAMTYTTLIVRNFRRNRLRTALTAASIMLAGFLVCAVLALPSGLAAIVDRMASATRLSVHNKAGIAYLLPYSYLHKIRAVPGV